MRSILNFSQGDNSIDDYIADLDVVLYNVGRGTKKATEKALKSIRSDSDDQVPIDTHALINSSYYEVFRRADTARTYYTYGGVVGYGHATGNSNINPKSDEPVTSYMLKVHEDLTATHTRGHAKFLERAFDNYAKNGLREGFAEAVSDAILNKDVANFFSGLK